VVASPHEKETDAFTGFSLDLKEPDKDKMIFCLDFTTIQALTTEITSTEIHRNREEIAIQEACLTWDGGGLACDGPAEENEAGRIEDYIARQQPSLFC